MSIKKKESEKSKNLGQIIVSVVLVLAVVLCLYVTIQVMTNGYVSFFGYSLFRVVTGSMEPEIPVGAILVAKKVDIQSLEMDDIVCFFSTVMGKSGQIVTHRIVDIFTDESGALMLETKGDANLVSDLQYVTQSNLIGQVVYHTSQGNLATNVLSFLTTGVGFLACLALPIMVIAGLIMQDCVRKMKDELQQVMEEMDQGPVVDPDCPYQYFTKEDYNEMYEKLRQEMAEELGLPPEESTEPKGMSQEEYDQMCARIRAELVEELSHSGE